MDNLSSLIPHCLLAFNASMFAYDPSPYTSLGIAVSAVLWIAAKLLARTSKPGLEASEILHARLESLEKMSIHASGEMDYMKRKLDSIATTLQMQQLGR